MLRPQSLTTIPSKNGQKNRINSSNYQKLALADLETEIQEKTRNAMVKGLGASKENKVAVGRITGMKNV